jgi:hypothetical protein
MTIPSPQELDRQCKISIDRWVDIYSEDCKLMDSDHQLTVKWFKMFLNDALFVDTKGRIFGKGKDGSWYPYHFEYGKQLIGYKLSAMAAN